MMEDKSLENLFAQFNPPMGDSAKYMEDLTRKLEAVESVRAYGEAKARQYKRMMCWVFVLGGIVGGGVVAGLLMFQTSMPLFSFQMQMGLMQFIQQNSQLILLFLASLVLGLGIVGLFVNQPDTDSVDFHVLATQKKSTLTGL